MSGEIKRTGPPTARDMKGRLVTWAVPLNAMPDKEWTVTCTPNHVHVYQGMMVFESLEDDVPTWITFIDKWTAAANTRHAQLQASQAPKKAEGPRDRERRLGELNDKFKNL
jgi:hypothetical protein